MSTLTRRCLSVFAHGRDAVKTTIVSLGCVALGVPAFAQDIPDKSDLFHNPYNKYSAHHRPVGAGAEYGVPGTSGPGTRGRIGIVTKISLSSAPATKKYIHRVQPTDPTRRITYDSKSGGKSDHNGLPITLRMPEGVPYPTKGEDRNVILWPRDGGNTDMCTMFYGFNNLTGTARYSKGWPFKGLDFADGSDSYDPGSGASRMRWPSGVMRGFEINSESPAPIRTIKAHQKRPPHDMFLGKIMSGQHTEQMAPPMLRTAIWETYLTEPGW